MEEERGLVTQATWQLMVEQARILVKSNLLPTAIKSPEQAVAIMLTGYELGIPPMTAFRMIDVIQGAPTLKPQLMLALILRTGQLEKLVLSDDGSKCTVTMKRHGLPEHTSAFSMEDAQRMMTTEYVDGQKHQIPLANKYNWRQMPAVMRQWRAIGACARVLWPDVVLGMYSAEEMGATVDDMGTVIVTESNPPPLPTASVLTDEIIVEGEVEGHAEFPSPASQPASDEQAEPESELSRFDKPPLDVHSPTTLFKWVNMQDPAGYYTALPHLLNAIKQEYELEGLGEVKSWPSDKDIEAWGTFGQAAVRHARKCAAQK